MEPQWMIVDRRWIQVKNSRRPLRYPRNLEPPARHPPARRDVTTVTRMGHGGEISCLKTKYFETIIERISCLKLGSTRIGAKWFLSVVTSQRFVEGFNVNLANENLDSNPGYTSLLLCMFACHIKPARLQTSHAVRRSLGTDPLAVLHPKLKQEFI